MDSHEGSFNCDLLNAFAVVLKNSIDFFQSFSSTYGTYKQIDVYVVTPNYKSVQVAAKNDVCNFSFITSVSNMFQTKNTNMTIADTKNEIKYMVDLVKTTNEDNKIKLYISCFTEIYSLILLSSFVVLTKSNYIFLVLPNVLLSERLIIMPF